MMQLAFLVFQEYTENLRGISVDGVLHLFQGKYAYSIIVIIINYSYVLPISFNIFCGVKKI